MRILHLTHQYPPETTGGVETHVQTVAQALASREHAVAVFYRRARPGKGVELAVQDRVNVFAVWSGTPSPLARFAASFRQKHLLGAFRQAVQTLAPQIIHIHHLMGLPFSIVREIRRHSLPIVVTLHDYWWVCANAQLLTNYSQARCSGPQGYWNCAQCALARIGLAKARITTAALPVAALVLAYRSHLLRRILASAQALIAPSNFVRRWYEAQGLPQGKILVLPHGVEPPAVSLSPSARPGGLPLRFLYAGGLVPEKGVHVLVNAFADVKGDAQLWIAGDESVNPNYVAGLRRAASAKVRFLGRLDRRGLWNALAQADALLVPSLLFETFSLITSEAFALGVPVLASRLGALEERVQDGVNGFLLPPGHTEAWRAAIQRLVDDPSVLLRLRDGVRPPMTVGEHVMRLEEIYAQCLRAEQKRTG